LKIKKITSVLLFISVFASGLNAQKFYRFKAEVSIKDKLANGTYRLTMGKVYYDKIYKKVVYQLKFPKKETMVVQDTTMYTLDAADKLLNSSRTVLIPEFTVFHLALTNQLSNYGLKGGEEQQVYKIGKVEKTDKGVLTTWVPAEEGLKKLFGDIKMLKKGKRLDAMIFYDAKGKIVSRQFFKKYVNVKGVEFPQEVTMMSYDFEGKRNLQLTTYKNIEIDQNGEDNMYRYRIPITKSAGLRK
jgi:hypothetical protein